MASDLKIEIFAFKIFHKYWYDLNEIGNEPDVLEFYRDECAGDNRYLEACDNLFIRALNIHSFLLSDIYMESLAIEDIKDFTSLHEVYNYVIRKCDQDELFGNLSVFERMFSTSQFVMSICYFIYTEISCIKDILKYGHIFWVMYFDKFTEEFYKEGGWNKLKIVAKSYELLAYLLNFFGVERLWGSLKSLKEATMNYFHFKNALQYHESKIKRQYKACISAVWVKFRIKFYYYYIKMPLDYEEYVDAHELHLVLQDLRFGCDSSLCGKIYENEKFQDNSEESSLNEKAGTDNAFCNEVSHRLDFEKQSKSEDLISSSETVGFDIAENVENTQCDKKIQTEQEMTENSRHIQNRLPDLTTYRQLGESQKLDNFHQESSLSTLYVNDENKIEEFHSRNVKGQSEIPVITEVFSITQKDEYECITETARRSFCNPKDIGSLDACLNSEYEMINTKEIPEVEGQIENSETKNEESVTQMTPSKCDEKSLPDMLSKPKQLSAVNLCVDICDEKARIQRAREDLRNEQDDPDLKNFLRLILVLGDKQRIKSVRLTLRSNEESLLKSQEKPNKKKKRSKNKKSGM